MPYEPDADVFELFDDGRFADAAEALDDLSAEDPDNGTLLALRAVCAREMGDGALALEAAGAAVRRDPDNAFAHWALGAVLEDERRFDEAESAALRCLELAPWHVLGYGLLAQTHVARGRWVEAVAAADAGLAVDPDDEGCQALRLIATRGRDGADDWTAPLDSLLARFPASSWVRAGKGWAALERDLPEAARAHFQQALTLDPTSEWARAGLIEATKARNPVYRQLLRFFLWFDRLPVRTRWGVILVGLLLFRTVREATRANPGLAPVTYPAMAAWALFVLLSWTVRPLSDFVLWLDASTRHLVTGERRQAAHWVAGTMAAALFLTGLALLTRSEQAALSALGTGVLLVPMSAVFQCPEGWPRRAMGRFTALAALPLVAGALPGVPGAGTLSVTSMLLSVLGSWVGNVLATRRPGPVRR